ncbi:hypothetical protein LPJ63_003177 [Coemansia sp. RSA 2711]|nr:hypothetical protein LPJ63_003177 [Coemansia sp. RSA 2711]
MSEETAIVEPQSFVGVHDCTPDMRMLYVSSSIQRVLYFEPGEVIGQRSFSYLAYGTSREYVSICSPETGDSVTIFYAYITRLNAPPLYMRAVHFNCDGVGFNVCFVAPEPEVSPERLPFAIEDSSAMLADEDDDYNERDALSWSGRRPNGRAHRGHVGVVDSAEQSAPGRGHRRPRANSYLAQQINEIPRLPVLRACLVLSSFDAADGHSPMGPQILFASTTFDKIIGADTSDVHGLPFLSLVAARDVLKAARFLSRLPSAKTVALETLLFRYCPFEDCARSELVEVEVMGAGSGNGGAILLCQFKHPGLKISKRNWDSDAAYMSLDRLLSTDADTSDASGWRYNF